MHKYLYQFGYAWPDEIERCRKDPESDLGEAACLCFVTASSTHEAIEIGDEIAESFVQILFGHSAYSWKSLGFARWIEEDPEIVRWATANQVPSIQETGSKDIAAFAGQLVEWHRRFHLSNEN